MANINKIIKFTEKKKFMNSFSNEEFAINGFSKKKDLSLVVALYDLLLESILTGNYLELGCGTGMLSKYILKFSKKKIIPYGIDWNEKSIKIAKENHKENADKFICENYFNLSDKEIKKFSTIVLYIEATNKESWISGDNKKLIDRICNNCRKKSNIIIVFYDEDLSDIKRDEVKKFISYVKRKYKAMILSDVYVFIKNRF